jgi:hypothetical protein
MLWWRWGNFAGGFNFGHSYRLFSSSMHTKRAKFWDISKGFAAKREAKHTKMMIVYSFWLLFEN